MYLDNKKIKIKKRLSNKFLIQVDHKTNETCNFYSIWTIQLWTGKKEINREKEWNFP